MIQIYSLPNCANCEAAKRLAKSRDIEYEELDLLNQEVRDKLTVEIGTLPRSAPVIVDSNTSTLIGGFMEFKSWTQNLSEF